MALLRGTDGRNIGDSVCLKKLPAALLTFKLKHCDLVLGYSVTLDEDMLALAHNSDG